MNSPKIFVARLLGLDVFDPLGDRLGRLRDVVVLDRGRTGRSAATGLVIEVPGKKRVFVPMTRVTSMDSGQIITTGLINLRRFSRRGAEQTVAGDLFDRRVHLTDGSGEAVVEDLGLERQRNGDWLVSDLYVRRDTGRTAFGRSKGEHLLVAWDEALWGTASAPQAATSFVAAHEDLKAADLADMLHEMTEKRRVEVANELQDERLADVLQELPDDDQVQILSHLDVERAADVLEEMDPDDAADLLHELPDSQQELLLELMEPEDAEDVRRLLEYEEDTVGSVMTPVPVVLPPEATVAEAMATIRQQEISPALASLVIVARPPLETPTGRYLGVVHFQRLLRYPPPEAIGNIMDKDLEPVSDLDSVVHVTRELATYNLTSIPVVNAQHRVVGAVSVDDVLDHILPEDWRAMDPDETPEPDGATPARPSPPPHLTQIESMSPSPRDPREARATGLDTPLSARRRRIPRLSPNPDAFGEWTEGIARFMGTPQFLLWMTLFCLFWVGWNSYGPEDLRFDSAALGFTALTLMLSLQASYAAPLLLLAQNRQDDRDKVALREDRDRAERNLADTEYLTREISGLRLVLQDVATRDYVRGELRGVQEDLVDELREAIREEVRAELRAEAAGPAAAEPAPKAKQKPKKKARSRDRDGTRSEAEDTGTTTLAIIAAQEAAEEAAARDRAGEGTPGGSHAAPRGEGPDA